MQILLDFIAMLSAISLDKLLGVIALTSLGLAAFAIYVVFTVVTMGRSE